MFLGISSLFLNRIIRENPALEHIPTLGGQSSCFSTKLSLSIMLNINTDIGFISSLSLVSSPSPEQDT